MGVAPGQDRRLGAVQEAAEVVLGVDGRITSSNDPGEPWKASTGGSSTVGVKLRM